MSEQRAPATLPPDPSQYVPGRMVSGLPAPTRPVTLDGQAVIPEQPAAPQPPVTAQPQTAAGRAQALNSPMLLSDVIASPGGADALADALIHREGGSPAGVVNNPGNIKFAGLPGQRDSGVQATDGGTFASYDSPQEGRQAIIRLAANAAAGQSFAYGQKPTVATFASIYGGHQGGSEGTTPNYQAITARSQQIADRESAEIRRLTAEADKADPDSQLRHQRLQQAMDHSERLSQQFEEMARHPPTETPLDMMQNFGSLATVIALAGGLLAKRPLTVALNAAGSAMRAQQEGNHEQAQRAYKVWQDQTELISKALNFQNQEINQIMEDRRISEAERRDKIADHLRLYGMQQALDQWNLGNQVEVYKLIAAQPKMVLEMEQMQKHMALMQAQTEALHGGKGWQILTEPVNKDEAGNPIQYRYNPNTGEATTLTGQPYTPSGAEKLAPGYAPRSAPAMYMQAYMRDHPHALPSELSEAMGEYRRIQALETGFASGVLGRQVIALNTVADHLLLVKEYAEALNNGQIPRANAIANQISKETGGPAVTNFDAGRDIMADEVVRLLTTTGGTEADRQGMQSRISSAFSPAQFAGVINVFERFVHGRFEALQQQYAQGDANRIKHFRDDILTDKARQVYGGATPAESSAFSYSSPVDVEQAFMTGKITKEQAEQILIEKFGAKQ